LKLWRMKLSLRPQSSSPDLKRTLLTLPLRFDILYADSDH
jgi:hypothetical protein